jgi:hypothetical protein
MRKEASLKSIDLSKKLKPYEGKWVALSLDYKKILGSGESLKKAKEEAEKKSVKYMFIKLPPFNVRYVPSLVYEISLCKNSNSRSTKKVD